MDILGRFLGSHRTASIQAGKNHIEVFDWGFERVVKFNGVVYSRLNTESLYTHEYWDFFVPLGFVWERPSLLMIGLGGGTIAFQLSRLRGKDISMEAVDISKEMIGVMKGFLPGEVDLGISIGDGAEFVKGKKAQYSIIILDAYINDLIPEQFFTREFIGDACEALTEDGVLGINYIKSSNGYGKFESYVGLLKSRFRVFRLHTGFFTGNTVLVCSKRYGKEEMVGRIKSLFAADSDNSFMLDSYERMEEL